MVTLLRVPDLVAAVEPLVGHPVLPQDVFRLIASGKITPHGYVIRAPIFTPEQVADVVTSLRKASERHKEVQSCNSA